MKKITKKILDIHPEEIHIPIFEYLTIAWEGTEDVIPKSRYQPGVNGFSLLVKDAVLAGWTSGISNYDNATSKYVDSKIKDRQKELEKELENQNQNDFFGFDNVIPTSNDEMLKAVQNDKQLANLKYLLEKISTEMIATQKINEAASLTSKDLLEGICKKYKGISSLRPENFSEWVNSSFLLSPIDSLDSDEHKALRDQFTGYAPMTKLTTPFPDKVSGPVVAWELNEMSVLPAHYLVASLIEYGHDLRVGFNHESMKNQVQLCSKQDHENGFINPSL